MGCLLWLYHLGPLSRPSFERELRNLAFLLGFCTHNVKHIIEAVELPDLEQNTGLRSTLPAALVGNIEKPRTSDSMRRGGVQSAPSLRSALDTTFNAVWL